MTLLNRIFLGILIFYVCSDRKNHWQNSSPLVGFGLILSFNKCCSFLSMKSGLSGVNSDSAVAMTQLSNGATSNTIIKYFTDFAMELCALQTREGGLSSQPRLPAS
jgi:hypothetical protein